MIIQYCKIVMGWPIWLFVTSRPEIHKINCIAQPANEPLFSLIAPYLPLFISPLRYYGCNPTQQEPPLYTSKSFREHVVYIFDDNSLEWQECVAFGSHGELEARPSWFSLWVTSWTRIQIAGGFTRWDLKAFLVPLNSWRSCCWTSGRRKARVAFENRDFVEKLKNRCLWLITAGCIASGAAVYIEEHYAAESDCIPSSIPQSISSLQLT